MSRYTLATYILVGSIALVGTAGCEGKGPIETAGEDVSETATSAMDKAKDVEQTLERAAEKTASEAAKVER